MVDSALFARVYPGQAAQCKAVRAAVHAILPSCPVVDDAVLAASELAANACQHSRSGLPGGYFTLTSRVRYLEALEMFSADQLMAGAGKPAKETAAQRAEKIVRDELDSRGGAMFQADLLRAIASQGLSEQAFRTGRALAGVTGSMVIGRKSTYAWHYEGMTPAQVAEATDPRLMAAPEPAAVDHAALITRLNEHLA
jgi:hypothetical protein